ncbi:methylated-DNA-[protein]-cysteine S-methyltransferase [Brevibacterium sanguinis]|uniref:Methylated-DNA--protein-cysteine methyltransferase n=2 Tax=Brevibacterium TaxID=1696 RepID=A0A366IJL6_9MICO|nr:MULTISPECIES: methylated-DNA--[protein]-cysteine S-methyltransferase [Brevibacterium]RBP64218.1 methylated-DNA-[protein]-cysteine S-methyltransferase [Brevibacterium sanguinis]RBP71490.1 methylated-DNA-[protein]-cysteine S-methyltransferase [Brevibacterium celere]
MTTTHADAALPHDGTGREPKAPVRFAEPRPGALLTTVIGSPLGELLLTSDGHSLTGMYLGDFDETIARVEKRTAAHAREDDALDVFEVAAVQLGEYFTGARREFDLPLAPTGTEFQRQVWRALTTIPYGSTAGYGELAGWLGRPTAARAVGAANGRNPITIIVPCHRVIGANGTMTGYAWGAHTKHLLLDLEAGRRPLC